MLDSTVVFSELMYHPVDSELTEWVELHNTLAVDMDLSGWRIDGVDFTFPNGTILPAGERLVVARSPDDLREKTRFDGALGPYGGQLDNGGELLQLINNSGRVMDQIDYSDSFPWPIGPDGSGASLAKRDADGGSEEPSNWTTSEQLGGTPGEANFLDGVRLGAPVTLLAQDGSWRFDDRGFDWGRTWLDVAFDVDDPNGDGDPSDRWSSGAGPLASSEARFSAEPNTIVSSASNTHYFRSEFTLQRDPDATRLNVQLVIDDGAVVYLNGQEAARVNMPDGPIAFDTPAKEFIDRAEPTGIISLPSQWLRRGVNVLAIEVHQAAPQAPTGGETLPASVMRISERDGYSLVWDGTDGRFFDSLAPPEGSRVPSNAALASERAVPFVSSQLGVELDLPFHRAENLNDGFYGNANSWIGGDANAFAPVQFAGVRFPGPLLIESIAWGRDNGNNATDACGGQCVDRASGTYAIQYTRAPLPGVQTPDTDDAATGWETIGFVTYRTNEDDRPGEGFTNYLRHEYLVRQHGAPIEATGIRILVPRTGLASGTAIDELEVYAGTSEAAPDVVFAATLVASPILDVGLDLTFAEVSAVDADPFFVELRNASQEPRQLEDFIIRRSADPLRRVVLPPLSVAPGDLVSLSAEQLGFRPKLGERLFLLDVQATRVIDAAFADNRLLARSADYGTRWLTAEKPTPGAENRIELNQEVVINEILYHAPGNASGGPDSPYRSSDEEWIELYNRGAQGVDMSSWQLTDAVRFAFTDGTRIAPGEFLVIARDPQVIREKYPEIADRVVGPFQGGLANRSETIRLLDERGNPVDEVRYYDGGRWPELADGGGSSLELTDPFADNSAPEAWRASDRGRLGTWQEIRYRDTVVRDGFTNGVTDRYREFILGLLDAGEVLIDDVSVIEDPDGAAIERIANGSFEQDILEEAAARWRIGGNHQAVVVRDPDDPANRVLRLVATGAWEDRLNHAETTLLENARIRTGMQYEISLRAKWLGGSNQLNTHLYFDRVQRTTLLDRGNRIGTPGRANSTSQPNIGPTYQSLRHEPVVPNPGQTVTVSVEISDPQRIGQSLLWYSVNGGPWASSLMSGASNGTYRGTVPGQNAGDVVQFYVASSDRVGMESYFPADGPDARAMYAVSDGQARERIHNFRIVMTPDDTRRLHEPTNAMSNGRIGATVIYNETRAYYDAGVRLKGSNAARTSSTYLGFNVKFDPMDLFRGVHESVAIDRSGRGATAPNAQDEILIKHIGNRVGQIPYMYDDLVRVIAPRRRDTRTALLMMARYTDTFLQSQFERGDEGTVFKMDIAYVPNRTVGGDRENPKLPFPYSHPLPSRDLENYGEDKERYRAHLLIRNNRARDDYRRIIAAAQALDQPTTSLRQAAEEVIDVDQWARVFALQSLTGVADAYTRGSLHHNISFYVRPEDGRVLALPWDWDFAFTASPSQGLIGTSGNGGRLMNRPGVRRLYYGHLLEIIETAFNNEYMDRWIDHYGQVAGQNLAGIKNYIRQRRSFVLRRLPEKIRFEIDTNAGEELRWDEDSITLSGRGWIDVRQIRLAETGQLLDARWSDDQTWHVQVPLLLGANRLTLEALNYQGSVVGSDEITVHSSVENDTAEALRIGEMYYHPQAPSDAERLALPEVVAEDFEFLEIVNRGSRPVQLAGVQLTGGVQFTFPPLELAVGARTIVVADAAAFSVRFGPDLPIAGEFSQGRLSNGGERLTLETARGATILDFVYDDQPPWPSSADGGGDSLELIDPDGAPASFAQATAWRAAPPSPATVSRDGGDFNGDGQVDALDIDLLALAIRDSTLSWDPNGDGQTNWDDHRFLVESVLRTSYGDADLNGRFDSADLLLIFQGGTYEDDVRNNARWSTGDFNGDGDFTTADLLAALKTNRFTAAALSSAEDKNAD